jgi:hypothetical protein
MFRGLTLIMELLGEERTLFIGGSPLGLRDICLGVMAPLSNSFSKRPFVTDRDEREEHTPLISKVEEKEQRTPLIYGREHTPPLVVPKISLILTLS